MSTNIPEHEPLFPERKAPEPPGYDERPIHPQGRCACGRNRIGGPLIAVVVLGFQWILKLKLVLFAVAKFSFVTTAVTMVVSVGAYTLLWGWRFAALFVLLLYVHELGHAIWLKREGIPAGAPLFIPFLGALISMRGMPRNAYIEAKVGLAGPVLGTLGAAAVLGLGELQDSDLLRAAAHTGFLLNLFNLLPIPPLDGGRRWRRSTRRSGSPASSASPRCSSSRRTRSSSSSCCSAATRRGCAGARARTTESASYYTVPAAQRIVIGCLYIGIAVACVLGMRAGYVNT